VFKLTHLHQVNASVEKSIIALTFLALMVLFFVDFLTEGKLLLVALNVVPLAVLTFYCRKLSLTFSGILLVGMGQLLLLKTNGISPIQPIGVFCVLTAMVLFAVRQFRFEVLRTLDEATTDFLTGLCNRRGLMKKINTEIRVQKRYGGVFSILVLDLDGFKLLNDTRGHHSGDLALKLFAEAIRFRLREVDTPARVGGDEFAILLPNTPASGAEHLCGLLLNHINEKMAEAGLALTASIGCKTYEESPGDCETALHQADKVMYSAKTKGKACYVCM